MELYLEAESLIKGVSHFTANLANLSSLIYNSLPDVNWAGFYLLEGDKLVLGPFQGKPACIEIPLGKGVCGTAAKEDRTLVVDDVTSFKGHIACDFASRSEIVIPLHGNSGVAGVIDIDSSSFSRFSENDREELEKLARITEKHLFV